ncbi:M48 family metallopeptidase [Cystobacter fuscus]|uniref:M48 family metallopeptidase n=1 Tax=Cystobacter fuscus TaxID=43 RepID=UPI002B2A0E7A|nr:M48 family metallopeptidase [Cystobacter fuscus]
MKHESHAELAAALWPDKKDVPVKLLTCRHCGRRNRVQVPKAVLEPSHCECGACGQALFLSPEEPLTRISSSAYEHSLDRSTLAALKALPGFPALVRWLMSNLGERSLRLECLSSTVMCGEGQFPELVELLESARHGLDFPSQPTLFLSESPHANAATFGSEEPAVIVYAGLLDHLDDTEVKSVLGHELGHLHAEHGLYRTVALVLAGSSGLLGTVGQLLSFPLQKALYKWMRCSELTADRAGLLACRDLSASLGVLMKLAGGHRPGTSQRTKMKLAPFVQQARMLAKQEESSWFDGLLAMLLTMNQSHPFIAWRVMHLLEWVEHGNYLDILSGHYERAKNPVAA